MSKKGGYQILDLRNKSISNVAITIEGIYNVLESNYHKPVMLSGLIIDDVEYDSVYVDFRVDGTDFIGDAYGYTFRVTDDNEITAEEISIDVPKATTTKYGIVKIGENLKVNNGTISVDKASDDTAGVVAIGDNIKVSDGVISVDKASDDTAGVVTIGSGLTVDDGEVSLDDSNAKYLYNVYIALLSSGSPAVGTVNQFNAFILTDNDNVESIGDLEGGRVISVSGFFNPGSSAPISFYNMQKDLLTITQAGGDRVKFQLGYTGATPYTDAYIPVEEPATITKLGKIL